MSLDYIGYVAAFLTTAAFLPQALHTIKTRNTDSLSLSMYILFTLGVLCWLFYGIILQDHAIIVANGITFCLSLTVLIIKLINTVSAK